MMVQRENDVWERGRVMESRLGHVVCQPVLDGASLYPVHSRRLLPDSRQPFSLWNDVQRPWDHVNIGEISCSSPNPVDLQRLFVARSSENRASEVRNYRATRVQRPAVRCGWTASVRMPLHAEPRTAS